MSFKNRLYIILILFFTTLFYWACKKDVATESGGIMPTIDTTIIGNVIFKEPPTIITNNGVTITVNRSCPCNPSWEIYYFSANAPFITDTVNTIYTWTIRMASNIVLTGKNAQYMFAQKGTWDIELEIKTNNQSVYRYTFNVQPYGQRVNNRNVVIKADCIDANRKYFVSLFSPYWQPLDGYVNAIFWDLGDGTILKDTNYIQHKYPMIQKDTTYFVKQFINNSNGCKDSAILPVFVPATYVNDTGVFINVKKFTWSKSNHCKPNHEEFTFIADTSGMPANAIYEWDFKDYVKGVRGKIVKHKFTYPNRYDVNLRVWHNGRIISEWYDTTVRANGQYVTPIAFFYSSVEQDTLDTVRRFFNCQSKFDNGTFLDSIHWTFGDGFSLSRPKDDYNARHTYKKLSVPMTYDVRMIIRASSGCFDTSYTKVVIPKL